MCVIYTVTHTYTKGGYMGFGTDGSDHGIIDVVDDEFEPKFDSYYAVPTKPQAKKKTRGSKVTVKCQYCKEEFQARKVDRARGWARFCSKSCKAKYQSN